MGFERQKETQAVEAALKANQAQAWTPPFPNAGCWAIPSVCDRTTRGTALAVPPAVCTRAHTRTQKHWHYGSLQ